MTADFDVVTGAFGYSGAAIASELQAAGRRGLHAASVAVAWRRISASDHPSGSP